MSEELPLGWVVVKVNEIADINPRHPKGLPDSMLVSFAPMPSLNADHHELGGLRDRPLSEVRTGFTHFADGDILFAKITPCMENGKGAVAAGLRNGLGCGTTEVHVVRPLGCVAPHYIYHYLHQPSVRRDAESSFTGSAGQARVPVAFIKELELPLAPLPEQRRIVAKLEVLLGKVDACRKRLEKIPVILKRFRQSVLAAACSGRLTADWREQNPSQDHGLSEGQEATPEEAPEGWRFRPLRDVLESSLYGPRFGAEDYAQSGVPTVRTTDMGFDGSITLADAPRLNLSPKEYEKYGLKDGDLMVTRTGATIGKCAVYDKRLGPAIPSAYLIRFRFNHKLVSPQYVLRFFMSPEGQNLLVGGSTAVAQPNVNATTIAGFVIPLPPLPEQREIVRRVETLFALADQIETRYAKAKTHVDRLTQSILAKAFRGELVPQDPDDEPASVLLERIGAMRQETALSRQCLGHKPNRASGCRSTSC